MGKKILALFVLAAFLAFDWSCTVYTTKKFVPPEITPDKVQGMGITGMITKSGEKIVFSEKWLMGKDSVVGVKTGEEKVRKEVQRSDVKEFITDSVGRKQAAIMADGSVYWIISMTEEASGILIVEYYPDAFAVPYSDIESFQVRKTDIALTILATIGIVCGLAIIYAALNPHFISNPLSR
jgi:hypothetical protein